MSYEAMRMVTDAQTAMFRTFFMPPKSPQEAVNDAKTDQDLWKNPSSSATTPRRSSRIRCSSRARTAQRSWLPWERSGRK